MPAHLPPEPPAASSGTGDARGVDEEILDPDLPPPRDGEGVEGAGRPGGGPSHSASGDETSAIDIDEMAAEYSRRAQRAREAQGKAPLVEDPEARNKVADILRTSGLDP